MKKIISVIVILGVSGLLGCGEAKKAGKAELKGAVEDRTTERQEAGGDAREAHKTAERGDEKTASGHLLPLVKIGLAGATPPVGR